ncbi:uncharacterized protein [Centruroides vittatus]|uniref:uncharacterized protein isoform X2 n=1 Tax=Centruroides vittatus TaxID=120091 RepID=UPI003510C93B
MVELRNTKSQNNLLKTMETNEENNYDEILNNVKGKIIHLNNQFGFIELCQFAGTTVYFDKGSFERGVDLNLEQVAKVGDIVTVKAKRTEGHKAKYRAIKVWKEKSYPLHHWASSSSITSISSQESKGTETIKGIGHIVKLFPTYGYIRSLNRKIKIFFHKDKVVSSDSETINLLSEIFKINDIVHFDAIPSRLNTTETLYEATKVWTTTVEDYVNEETDFSESSTSTPIHLMSSFDDDDDDDHIFNETGKIFFSEQDNCIAKIKFEKKEIIISSDIPFYNNEELDDLAWAVDEGDEVQFDAEFQADMWKALIVWKGNKPEKFIKQKKSKKSFKECNDKLDKSKVSDYNLPKINSFAIKKNPKSTYASKLNKLDSLSTNTTNTKTEKCSKSKNSFCKVDDGWNEDTFDIKNEEWPDLNIKSKLNYDKNNKECKKTEINSFISNDLKYSNKLNMPKNQTETSVFLEKLNVNDKQYFCFDQNLDDSNVEISECEKSVVKKIHMNGQFETFQNEIGRVKHLTKEYGFLNCDKFTEEKPFYWEDVFYDGLCISEHFSGLNEIFEEFELLNFNFLRYTDEDQKVWERITLVWKGNKPEHFTEITPEQFLELMGIFSPTKSYSVETEDVNSISKRARSSKNSNPYKKNFAANAVDITKKVAFTKEEKGFNTRENKDESCYSNYKVIVIFPQ